MWDCVNRCICVLQLLCVLELKTVARSPVHTNTQTVVVVVDRRGADLQTSPVLSLQLTCLLRGRLQAHQLKYCSSVSTLPV